MVIIDTVSKKNCQIHDDVVIFTSQTPLPKCLIDFRVPLTVQSTTSVKVQFEILSLNV